MLLLRSLEHLIVSHGFTLVLGGRMDILLHDPDGAVAEDSCEGCEVDAHLRKAGFGGPLNQASHWRNSDRVLGKDESEAGRKGPRCSGAALVQVPEKSVEPSWHRNCRG